MFVKVVFQATAGLYISFLNFLTDNNITLENIKNTPIGFTAVCQGKDYFFIAKNSKRFQTKVRIIRKKGCLLYLKKIRKRKGIFVTSLLFLVFYFLFSNMIWRIDFNTVDYSLKNDMAEQLFRYGIYSGAVYNQEKLDIAVNNILQENDNLGYLTLNFYKGVLTCNAYARTNKEEYISDLGGNNIYSRKTGIITDVRVYNGFSQVVTGQSVSKGDILVSNIYTDRHGNIYTRQTRAYIEAECRETYSTFIPFNKSAEVFTGKTETEKTVFIFNKEFKTKEIENIPDCIFTEKLEYLSVMGFCLPVTVRTTTYHLTEITNMQKDINTALSYGKKQLEHIIKNDESLKQELSRDYEYSVMHDGITVSCKISGIYQIT